MKTYQCILSDNGFIKENFFRESFTASELLSELRDFEYGKGTWKIYLDDEFIISGSS